MDLSKELEELKEFVFVFFCFTFIIKNKFSSLYFFEESILKKYLIKLKKTKKPEVKRIQRCTALSEWW
jgi:hypothetical protein